MSKQEYWNNPLIELRWPNNKDPVVDSFHNGKHCLFFDPEFPVKQMTTLRELSNLCEWMQNGIEEHGLEKFASEPLNHYSIANTVRVNVWIQDIKKNGVVKPFLVLDNGTGTYTPGTGDTRLRCFERMPSITNVQAFISTTQDRSHLYQHLVQVKNFDHFAELCQAKQNQNFLFRLTDDQAPFGMYWYEYDSQKTRQITPSYQDCVDAFFNYMKANPDVKITPEWFDEDHNWPFAR